MLDTNKIKEAERSVKSYLEEGLLKKAVADRQIQYRTLEIEKQSKAKTSLQRTKEFAKEIDKLLAGKNTKNNN